MKIFPWFFLGVVITIVVLGCNKGGRRTKWFGSSPSRRDPLLGDVQAIGSSDDLPRQDATTSESERCLDSYVELQQPSFLSKKKTVDNRIMGGLERPADYTAAFQWTVLLLIQGETEVKQCMGALVAWDEHQNESDIVVTAAHCLIFRVSSFFGPFFYNPLQVLAVAGKYDISRKEDGEQRRYAARYGRFSYDKNTKKDDIVVVKVGRAIAFSDTIKPLYLPGPNEVLPVTTDCYATGWGHNQNTGYLPKLRVLKLNRRPDAECERIWNPGSPLHQAATYNGNWMVCGKPQNFELWADLCDGDDGAPLACAVPTPMGPKWKLFGVFSVTHNGSCDVSDMAESFPIFTKVASYSKWVTTDMIPVLTMVGKLQPPRLTSPTELVPAPGFGDEVGPLFPDDDCGKQDPAHPQNLFPNLRVVGGNEANAHSWPWQVRIEVTVDALSQNVYGCGGSLFRVSKGDKASDIVITAAHCLIFKHHGVHYEYHPMRIKVKAGRHDLENHQERWRREAYGVKLIVHANYSATTSLNDIALIRLNEKIPFGPAILPLCLPKSSDAIPGKDAKCAVIGWGKTDIPAEGPGSTKLHQCKVEIFTPKDCLDNGHGGWRLHSYPEMICAGSMDQPGNSCTGDSGGPVMCYVVNRWMLFGISSFRANASSCFTPGMPPVSANVVEYSPWIRHHASIWTSINRQIPVN